MIGTGKIAPKQLKYKEKGGRCWSEPPTVKLRNLQPSIDPFHRWIGYLGLLLFDVIICLLALFGLIRNSKGTLIG